MVRWGAEGCSRPAVRRRRGESYERYHHDDPAAVCGTRPQRPLRPARDIWQVREVSFSPLRCATVVLGGSSSHPGLHIPPRSVEQTEESSSNGAHTHAHRLSSVAETVPRRDPEKSYNALFYVACRARFTFAHWCRRGPRHNRDPCSPPPLPATPSSFALDDSRFDP